MVINYIGLSQKGIKIFHLNICHLSNKIDELKNTVLCNNPAIDICGFTETFLTNLTDDARINVNGYNLFRKDRAQGAGGGILIYVLDKWNVIRRTDLESERLETVWLEITFPNTKSLFVWYIYRPPNSPVAWYDRFSNELEKVSYLNCETILTGDFNFDLLQPDVALNGRWHDVIQINNFTQIVKEPTRITENTCTLIYVKNIDYIREIIY